jgi:hypothetical protein
LRAGGCIAHGCKGLAPWTNKHMFEPFLKSADIRGKTKANTAACVFNRSQLYEFVTKIDAVLSRLFNNIQKIHHNTSDAGFIRPHFLNLTLNAKRKLLG